MFSAGDEKYWSTAAASAPSAACSMLAVRRQKKPISRRVRGTASAARRKRNTTATEAKTKKIENDCQRKKHELKMPTF